MNKRITDFIDKNIKYLGVSGISIRLNNILILVDPYVNIDTSFVASISRKIKEVHIFISHGHYDHYEFVSSIINSVKARYPIKIFLPPDIYKRDKARIIQNNVRAYSMPDYSEGMQSKEYSVTACEGKHVNVALLFNISLVFDLKIYPEILRHFSYPAKDVINFIFKIKRKGISLGHIGSPCVSRAAAGAFKKIDAVFLAMAPRTKFNIENMELLSPRLCVPIHHVNSPNGLQLIKDMNIDMVKKKYKKIFYEIPVWGNGA